MITNLLSFVMKLNTPRTGKFNTGTKQKSFNRAAVFAILLSATAFAHAGFYTGIAARGYAYGFPLVLLAETRDGLTGDSRACSLGADINTFANVFDLPDESFKAVVRPNVDTLYTSAMLDLSISPQFLHMPAVEDRYVLMALLDAWSNNFAGVGTQTHGEEAGRYFIVGPNDTAIDTPQGYTRIEAPTNLVWIIGRTEIKGEQDIWEVNEIQKRYELIPYKAVDTISGSADCVPDADITPPLEVVKSMSSMEFFERLSELLMETSVPEEDIPMLISLGDIGVGPYARRGVNSQPFWVKFALEGGKRIAQFSLDTAIGLLGYGSIWSPNPKYIPLGDYRTFYFVRAVVSQVGFGANKGEYAVYQNASRDAEQRLYTSDHLYKITFPADDLPPVNAFWSLTVYGSDGFLAENQAPEVLGFERHSVGSNSNAEYNPDGSLTVYFSHLPPEGVPMANWLPVPDGEYQVTMRLYDPGESILNGTWQAPPIERVE